MYGTAGHMDCPECKIQAMSFICWGNQGLTIVLGVFCFSNGFPLYSKLGLFEHGFPKNFIEVVTLVCLEQVVNICFINVFCFVLKMLFLVSNFGLLRTFMYLQKYD